MTISGCPFAVSDWPNVPAEEHRGERGSSFWRTVSAGNLRVRRVEYSPGFVADHWCARGHVVLVLSGRLDVDLRDGRSYRLEAGTGFQAGDDEANPHRVRTGEGATVFIVD